MKTENAGHVAWEWTWNGENQFLEKWSECKDGHHFPTMRRNGPRGMQGYEVHIVFKLGRVANAYNSSA